MAKRITLKCFSARYGGVTEKGELPSRLKLFDWGTNKTNKGDFIVDDRTHACFAENQEAMARQTIQVDFNHNTVEGSPAYLAAKGSPEIAGYGVPVCVRGKGIFLEKIDTTPHGVDKAADYKDLSPAPLATDDGLVVGLHSVALVPAGSTDGLTLESAALKALSASLKVLSVPEPMSGGPKTKVNAYANGQSSNDKLMEEETMKKIHEALGLEDGASYEQVCEKLKPMYEMKGGKKGPLDSPHSGTEIITHTLDAKIAAALGAAITPLQAEVTRLQTELASRAATDEQAEKDRIMAQASKDGKIVPLTTDEVKEISVKLLNSVVGKLKGGQIPVELKSKTRPTDKDGKEIKLTRLDAARAIEEQITADGFGGHLKAATRN